MKTFPLDYTQAHRKSSYEALSAATSQTAPGKFTPAAEANGVRVVKGFALLFRNAAKPDSQLDPRIAAFLGKLAAHQDRTSGRIAEMKESDHWIR